MLVESDQPLPLIVTVFLLIFTLQIPPDLDTAVAQRLERFNAIEGNPIAYSVFGKTADADGAIIYLQPISRATGEPYPGIVDWAVALNTGGSWGIYLPGDSGYTPAYAALPAAVLRRADSTPYTTRANADYTVTDGYNLPFPDGGWGTVTRSYRQHGTGRIDFDVSGRDISAAKDGIIVYANDSHSITTYNSAAWWYWNTVIIQHGEREYSLYGHIAPGSIPQNIKTACTADLSAPNCFIPVKAGDVIAHEGNTGYSSNPHLHIEFGQGFSVAAYMDTADEDGDGIRAEPVYAGYLYAEQNVGLNGYTPREVAVWEFGALRQAAHSPAPPAGVNLLLNADFSAGTENWIPSGQVNWLVQDGVMRITRLNTADPPAWASFYQDVSAGIPAHTPFEATLQLGNASGTAKTVTVSVYNRYGRQYGSFECAFQLAANAPLALYTIHGSAVNSWASLRFEVGVNPPDSAPAALVDDISLRLLDSPTSNECITPVS